MSAFSRSAFAALLLFSLQIIVLGNTFGEDAKPPALDPELSAADQLYRAGKFAEAEARYQALLKTNSKLLPAQVGLVRAMLRQQKIDEALDAANAALATLPNSAALLAAKGDVQFRRAEMSDAEVSYLTAKKLDPKEVHAYLGLARLYSTYSMYRIAYGELQIAHQIAPGDLDVQRAWLRTLPRKEQLALLEAYLAGAHPDDEQETKQLTDYLEFLKATADKPIHACRLISKIEQTESKLETLYGEDSRRVRGFGLAVKLNDRNVHLLLDTGAGGITVNRKVAEKAGLTRISSAHYGGIGDKGLQSGYIAAADHIQIGELEFQDCVVHVSEKTSVAENDGLIGADVFGAYLVDIDFPGERLKLSASPAPRRHNRSEVAEQRRRGTGQRGTKGRQHRRTGCQGSGARHAQSHARSKTFTPPAQRSLRCAGDGQLDESLPLRPRHVGADQRERFQTHAVRTRHRRVQQYPLSACWASGRQGGFRFPRSSSWIERRGEPGLQLRQGDFEFRAPSTSESRYHHLRPRHREPTYRHRGFGFPGF
ncbi:MAG: aspartyl protease family protein [Terriglobales bacterium]